MWKRRAKYAVFRPEDYDQPTEPLEKIVLPAPAQPSFQQDLYAQPQANAPAAPYQNQVYPVLPPAPGQSFQGQIPAGALSAFQPARRRRKSPIPGLVGFLLVLVQLILLSRVVCMLLNVTPDRPWFALLFAASDLFAWPARWLVANINTSVLAGTQLLTYLEFLLIILVYGLLSRFLVRLLQALLNG